MAPHEIDVQEDSDTDYKDDDSLDEPAPFLAKDPVQVAFDEIIDNARKERLNLGKKEKRKEFMDRYGDLLLGKTAADGQTLLHVIANTLGHKSLTRCVVKMDPSLLEHKDDSGKTPLHIAIAKKNFNFLDVIDGQVKDLDPLLRLRGEMSRNCIHMAIYHGLGESYALTLIERASEETLCAVDQCGMTPLHLAVEYERSSSLQVNIVMALLQHGDKALDLFTTTPKDLSVYEYHIHTRVQAARKLAAAAPRSADASQEPLRSLYGRKSNVGKIARRHELAANSEGYDRREKKFVDATGKGNRTLGKADGLRLKQPPILIPTGVGLAEVQSPQTTAPGQTPDGIQRPESPGPRNTTLERRATLNLAKDRGDEERTRRVLEDEKRAEYADKIAKEIKLHYLRTTFAEEPNSRDQQCAVRFLHGANTDNVSLCFDHPDSPTNIRKDNFLQSYDFMKFDSVLRYVSFKKIKLLQPAEGRQSKLTRSLPQRAKGGRGRSDLTFFFDWLRGRSVTHILKVAVDDTEDPHSDEAIEECLKRFNVETLDWRRTDLCPETLFNACPDVRELHLRWSGNRAVLRAWGEPDGLQRLQKLENVHLVWNAERALESAERIGQYIRDFQQRLDRTLGNTEMTQADEEKADDAAKPKRKILVYAREVNVPDSERLVQAGAGAKPAGALSAERNLQSHRWLDCMDRFADEIQNVAVPATGNEALRADIKVALIDDGVDLYAETLRGKVRGGESFDRGRLHENGPSPYYTSATGHGTVMADMICRVCPVAKLYVYKLETHAGVNPATGVRSHEQISVESATAAIRAAVSQKVDLISISWTVTQTPTNHAAIASLREAVKAALDARVLIFCAAADTGALTGVEYPWSCDRGRILRIGAATADGRVWGPTGDPQAVSFVVPGHRVVARSGPGGAARVRAAPRAADGIAGRRNGDVAAAADDDEDYGPPGLPAGFEERTGSSVATALAAGLAALVLHCVRLAAIHGETEGAAAATTRAPPAAAGAHAPPPGTAPPASGAVAAPGTAAPAAGAVRASDLARLREHEGMLGALRAVGLADGGGGGQQARFIEVWRRFDAPAQALRDVGGARADPQGALRVVSALARDLVAGIAAGGGSG